MVDLQEPESEDNKPTETTSEAETRPLLSEPER